MILINKISINERLKITNLRTQKFLIKNNINHFLLYFKGAKLIKTGEEMTSYDVKNNQVFIWKGDTHLIEIIDADEIYERVY